MGGKKVVEFLGGKLLALQIDGDRLVEAFGERAWVSGHSAASADSEGGSFNGCGARRGGLRIYIACGNRSDAGKV